MGTLSTLNENLFQGHTTKNNYISNKIQTFRKQQQGLCQGLYQVRAAGARIGAQARSQIARHLRLAQPEPEREPGHH